MTPPQDEENFARRMAELRVQQEMSQSELARKMVEAGFDTYSQMTVSRTEKGDRPIRLGEARVLAKILDSSVEQMTRGSDVEENVSYAELVKHGLTTEIIETARRLDNYVDALGHASEAMSRLRSYDADEAREAIADLEAYVYPASVIATWAAEVATDPMRDAPDALVWTDLQRMGEIKGSDGEH
ncbi:helix-turn-helix transcriptional regulator [Microbacterium sp. A204]|uniref:helix-turn-helix transcriptional regulator n=1 Tax=Microbacterium sp. A204 TaxID=3457321 RepID=UPI003FCF3B26